jgi:hypothetical protein
MWNRWTPLLAVLLAPALGAQGQTQTTPWSKGAGSAPLRTRGYVFQVPDVDNIPDLPRGIPLIPRHHVKSGGIDTRYVKE